MPVRRHIQENSYLETPHQTDPCKTVVVSSRSEKETEEEFYEKAKIKIDLFNIEQPLQETFYKDNIQKLLVLTFVNIVN